jgi:hypothetical protein
MAGAQPKPANLPSGPCGAGAHLPLELFRFEQAVQVHHHIAHFGIVNRTLRLVAPGLFGLGIGCIDANQIKAGEVRELKRLRIADAAAHHKVKFLVAHRKYPGGGWMARL